MKTVTIHDAKTNLSKYIAHAKQGQTVYIGGFGKAEVMLVKVSDADVLDATPRDISIAKGKVAEKPHSFSPTTDQEVAGLLQADL